MLRVRLCCVVLRWIAGVLRCQCLQMVLPVDQFSTLLLQEGLH